MKELPPLPSRITNRPGYSNSDLNQIDINIMVDSSKPQARPTSRFGYGFNLTGTMLNVPGTFNLKNYSRYAKPPFARQIDLEKATRPISEFNVNVPGVHKYQFSCDWDQNDFFNLKNTVCCDGKLYRKSGGASCCGTRAYSQRKQFCCDGLIGNKRKDWDHRYSRARNRKLSIMLN